MNLFFREFGVGKPFVILHGLFGMSDNWVMIAKQISEHGYRVVVPDLRNHGQSFHSSRFDYPAMVEDVQNLFNDLCITNAIILGHSMGGKVAMNFALSYPEKVEKLIVADMGVKEYSMHNDEILDTMLSIDFTAVSSRKEIEAKLKDRIKSNSVGKLLMKNLTRIENKFSWKPDIHSIKANYKNIFIRISAENIFSKPSLFIRGELSDYVKDEDFQDIQKVFPNALFITVPNASHWVHVDNPEFFIEKVLEFA